MTLSITVVVMGYRNGATIVEAVASVHRQLGEHDDIVVVTSGPDSGIDGVQRRFPNVGTVVVGHRLTPGAARNAGIAAASGDVVAFLAGDCVALPGFVETHRAGHARGFRAVAGSVACFGPLRPPSVASWLISYRNRLPGIQSEVIALGSPRRHGLSIDRHLAEVVGPYDETVEGGEDSMFANRVQEIGVAIWFDAKATVAHRGPSSLRSLMDDERRRARRSGLVRQGTGPRRWLSDARLVFRIVQSAATQGMTHGGVARIDVLKAVPWIAAGATARVAGYGANAVLSPTDSAAAGTTNKEPS